MFLKLDYATLMLTLKLLFTESKNGYIGGSLGCLIWHPYTFYEITSTWTVTENPVYVYYTIDRRLFGDGSEGKNEYKTW